MELFQLRYFVKVAEELNFRRAAEALFISQPALSQHIAKLERQMGVRLLLRNRQGVSLLPAGKCLYDGAKKLLMEADSLFADVCALSEDRLPNRLVVGLDRDDDSLTDQMIQGSLFRIQQKYPELELQLEHLSFDQAQEALDQGKIDVGLFMLRKMDYEAFPYKKSVLWEDRVTLAVNAQITGTPEELLEKYPLIQIKNDRRWESLIQNKARRIFKNVQIKYVDTMAQAMNYVSLQIGVIPAVSSSAAQRPGLRLLDLAEDGGDTCIFVSAIWKKDNRWIEELLRDQMAAN